MGNRLFAEHTRTAATGTYGDAMQAQPQLAETHYNLKLTLYRNGLVTATRLYFVEAAND